MRQHLLLIVMCIVVSSAAGASELVAIAKLDRNTVYRGDTVKLSIEVEGPGKPLPPDVSSLVAGGIFSIRGPQETTKFTIINWKKRSFTEFSYELTPLKAGTFTLPSLKVIAGAKTAMTRPLQLTVRNPGESKDFKLRHKLSARECFVGEPVTVTLTWYLNKNVNELRYSIPLLDDRRFEVIDIDNLVEKLNLRQRGTVPRGYEAIRVGADHIVVLKNGNASLDGKQYATYSFRRVTIPKSPGLLQLPAATVVCNIITGYQKRRRDPFGDPFGDPFFNRRRTAIVDRVVVPSDTPTLKVKPLPTKGRPASFSGLVGSYSIAATATPAEVSVGEPITLKVMVTGPEYLGNVVLPPLHQQASLSKDFKIPKEMADGVVTGQIITFTQTVRAKHAGVKAVPPIELSYFDLRSKDYRIARSEPIPLTVKSARVITAADAEGTSIITGSKIESRSGGIAHNYDDLSVLTSDSSGLAGEPLLFILFLTLPPLAYLILFVTVTSLRRRNANPAALAARKAFGIFSREIAQAEKSGNLNQSQLLDLLQQYLGARCGLPSGAIMFSDIKPRLSSADEQLSKDLEELFAACEASRYAGGEGTETAPPDLVRHLKQVVAALEKSL